MIGETVLDRIYQGEYTVYQRDGMYCFLKGKAEQTALSLWDSHALGGQYLFCPGNVENRERFCEKAIQYLKRWNRRLLFLWIENPEDCFSYWRSSRLEASDREQQISFDHYRLVLGLGWKINVKDDCFFLEFDREGCFCFTSGTVVLTGTGKELQLLTAGQCCGTLKAALRAEGDVRGPDFMKGLDAGIYSSRLMDEAEEKAAEYGYVLHSVSRVLIPDGKMEVEMRLTPQAVLDPERTCLKLKGSHFDTLFSSEAGRRIRVEAAADAAFVFQTKPSLCYKDREERLQTRKSLYLGISGSFSIEGDPLKLLCGLSGTETIGTREGGCLKFTPSMPGVFPYEKEDVRLGSMPWTGITGGGVYYCQPEAAALYFATEGQQLRFLEVPAARFTDKIPPVPMLPFREIEMDAPGELARLDEGLYHKRRKSLGAKNKNTALFHSKGIRAVTPQGILAEVMPEGNYQWVGFADISGNGDIPDMRLTRIGESVQSRLMQKDFLYIAASPEELAKQEPSDGFDFTLEGIRFRLLPKYWRRQDRKTLMVFKYSQGKSIKEAAGQYEALKEAAADAYNGSHQLKEGYENFIRAYEDAAFEGILAVNVPVVFDELPSEIGVLMRSVKPEDFYASFLLIEAGQISYDPQAGLRLSLSMASGMIDYRSDRKLAYESAPPDYDYLTREIKIQIQNGHIISFASSSEVLINRLFEAAAKAFDNPDGNCLLLDGKLAEDGGISKYQYALRQCAGYSLSGSGIENVWIQDMDLTVEEDGGGLFSMSGVLACRKLEQADLLGFGGDRQQEGLPFSRLVLRMPASGKMSMEYGLLVYDRKAACLRQGSFPSEFAVYLDSIMIVKSGEPPEKKGFTAITAPLSQKTPGKCYQAMVFQIQAGSMGKLSGKEGIRIELMLAFWEGEDRSVQYYAGVRLPGMLSAYGLKLQGLFKIGFSSISLEKQKSGYVMKLHNFGITILGSSFPKESSDIFLFSDGKNVGWYAAYEGDGEE